MQEYLIDLFLIIFTVHEKMLTENVCNGIILLKRGWERGMDASPQFTSADWCDGVLGCSSSSSVRFVTTV